MNIYCVLLLFSFSGWMQHDTPACKDFKTGKFRLYDPLVGTTLITRTDSIQTEDNGKEISVYRVSWINDCEYILTILEGPEELVKFCSTNIITVRITETFEHGYKFEGTASNVNFTFTAFAQTVE
jgi:hypothetical protein